MAIISCTPSLERKIKASVFTGFNDEVSKEDAGSFLPVQRV